MLDTPESQHYEKYWSTRLFFCESTLTFINNYNSSYYVPDTSSKFLFNSHNNLQEELININSILSEKSNAQKG